MYIDYRKLNKFTIKNKYPLLRIDCLFDQMGASWFSKINLRFAYHQMQVREEDVSNTSFCTRYGYYKLVVMPFSMKNAPTTFMNLNNRVYMPMLDKLVILFIDDIMIYSNTCKELEEHLREVPKNLRREKLYAISRSVSSSCGKFNFLGISSTNMGFCSI